jgi:sugar/nucleoside kinase (ribokinase family)
MYDLITIGSATRDVFLVSEQFVALKTSKVSTGVAECMALGSKIEIKEIVFTTGGGATNAAATFSKLGFRTAIITRVGNDSPGKDVAEDLSSHGVSTHLVKMIKNGQTAYSTLITMEDGERTALVYRGTSGVFSAQDVPAIIYGQTKWIYLTSLGGNVALSKKIIKQATKAGIMVAWNPGHEEIKNGLAELSDVIPLVKVLILNKEEAQLLTGKKKIEQMFRALTIKGSVCVITDGTEGSYAHRDNLIAHAGTSGAKAISRTGAGDAFGSGFVSALIKTDDLKNALRVGTVNAESVVQHIGAKHGIIKTWPSFTKKNRIGVSLSSI